MTIFQAIILGLVQGLTEFLPVSSSGHLVVARNIMGVTAEPLLFEIVVHVGTLLAVFVVFRRDIWKMICHPISKPVGYLILASIPAGLAGVLLDNWIESVFGGRYLAIGFLITAVLLTVAEKKQVRRPRKFNQMKPTDALAMGAMQAVALVPGISRSGSTIVGGLFMGLDRKLAARFSFLMSIPVILGSVVFKFKDLLSLGTEGASIAPMIVGALVAAISGYVAIRFFLNLISKKKMYGFAIYVAILAVAVLICQFAGLWFEPLFG